MVSEFHQALGIPARSEPTLPNLKERSLRLRLLREEYNEYLDGEAMCDLVEIADALGDMVYIIYGTALAYGIDLDAVMAEIHRSNMTKVPEGENAVIRSDGKILKPPTYEPPNLAAILGV